jgi:hypothetical protein
MTGSARLFRDHEEAFIALTDWVDFCEAMRARVVPVTSDDAKSFLNTLTPPKRKMKPFITLRRASASYTFKQNPLSLVKAKQPKLPASPPNMLI